MGASISTQLQQCADVKVVKTDTPETRSVNETLTVAQSDACFKSWENCKEPDTNPKSTTGVKIDRNCATPCEFKIPANTSTSALKMYRIPKELIPFGGELEFPASATRKLFLKPSMPFTMSYNDVSFKVDTMTIYHPCPVRIENVQYDAVLQLNDAPISNMAAPGNDTVILIPLAGSNNPDEAGRLFQKIAPFIAGMANTAVGDTSLTGGTTIASEEQQQRCEQIEDVRLTRWNIKLSSAVDGLKQEMIRVARNGGEGGKWVNPAWLSKSLEAGMNMTPDQKKKVDENPGIWKDDAFLWDVLEQIPGSAIAWSDMYTDADWERMEPILDRIRKEVKGMKASTSSADELKKRRDTDRYVRMIESGIPDPNESIAPCEILNVGVGQDWNLTKLIPTGGARSVVRVPYFTWISQKVEKYDERADPKNCTASYGLRPTGDYVRYIVMERPVRISSADLRSIRNLPAVEPTDAGIRFVNTAGIRYKNAPPENCTTCDAVADATKLLGDLKKGKVDRELLFKLLFTVLSAMVLVMGVYFGLRWAMGTPGDIFKNFGVKLGSYIKGVRESRTTTLPEGAKAPAQIFPSEKSKVSDVVPSAIKAPPSNLPASVYRSPQATKMVSKPTTSSISSPRRRSTFTSVVPQ